MIPRFSPDYRWSDLARCLAPSSKHAVTRLEGQIAAKAEHSSAVAFRYGRSGLYCLLKAIGAQNKKVILPAYTCVVVANAIVLSGNIPIFLDNEPQQFQPAPFRYLEAIDDETVMIVPTHLFGLAQETKDLYGVVKQRYPHVIVLQDCAHSFFSRDSTGEPVCTYGDAALFGMNISKLVNSVHGGALTLKDATLAGEVRSVRENETKTPPANLTDSLRARLYAFCSGIGFTPSIYPMVQLMTRHTSFFSSEVNYYQNDKIDLPSDFLQPLHPFEAEIGLHSLARLEGRIAARREIAGIYLNQLKSIDGTDSIVLPNSAPGNTWSHFPVLVPDQHRGRIAKMLSREFSVEIGRIVDYSIPDLAAYRPFADRPVTEAAEAAKRVLNLPLTFREGIMPVRSWRKPCIELANRLASMLS